MTVQNTIGIPGQLNPTLAVEAVLVAPVEGDARQTRFRLKDWPEIAFWLTSFVDHFLAKEGKLPGPKPIAPPPTGAARQALINGRIIFLERQPNGGEMLRLNSEFDMGLLVNVRLRGEPARVTRLRLVEDPDLSRWLLTYNIYGNSVWRQPWVTDALVGTLRRHGVLVDELPEAEAYFPDPGEAADVAVEFATACRVFPQPAGQALPPEVREALGRHVPALPPDTALLWGEDAGTGMVFPACWKPGAGQPALPQIPGPVAAGRELQWTHQLNTARQGLRERRYAALREIVPAGPRARLRHFVRTLVQRRYFPALGDGQVELRSAIHNQPTIASLHKGLAGIVSRVCGEPVIASYCYLSCYEEGAVLLRHKDRPQCAYNLSLVLDMRGPRGEQEREPEPWPIYLELDGKPEAVLLGVGDGLLYSGTDIWHWRDALPAGQQAIICFFHFVPLGFTGSLD